MAAAALLDRKRAPAEWIVAAPIIAGIWPNPGVIGMAFVQGWRYRRGIVGGESEIADVVPIPDVRP